MDYIKKYIVPLVLCIGIFLLMLVLRTVPVSRLWKGFSVLYVPVDTKPELIFDTLGNNGCYDVVSYYNQKVPFINEFLPVKSSSYDSYLSGRNAYFFDKDRSVMIYYIPEKYSKNASKAVTSLINDYGIDAGLDCKSSFPLLTPLICLAAFFVFLFLSKNKFIFLTASIFPLIYTFMMPFYTNAAAVSISLYSLFLMEKIWKRKGSIKFILNSTVMIIFSVAGIIASFFASFVSGLVFILSICGSILLLYVISNFMNYINNKTRFNPVMIRPAHLMNILTENTVKKSFISGIAVIILFVLYITSVNVFSISNSQDLSFPMPTRYNTDNGIPVIKDYVIWTWNSITMPYKSLNSITSAEPEEGESVVIQRFVNTEDGIKRKEEVLYTFDQDFKDDVIESIDDLNYPAVEKLMKLQDKGFSVDYSYGSGEKFSKKNIMLMLVLIILPFMMAIIYLTGRRKYGDSI